jgi:hypothetical protein
MPLFAWALVLMVASYAIQSLTMKTNNAKPASLEDFDFPQAGEGTPQAVFFGDNWTTGYQVLWYGNIRTIKIKAGGKK